jgi:hypothetical protein
MSKTIFVNDSCCRHIVIFTINSVLDYNIVRMMKVITISILVDCHRVTTDYLYVFFRLWILIIFVLPFFDYISEYVYEYGHTYSNIIVYVSSCLYSFKRNMFIRWLNPLISHGSLIDETTTIALLTFSFLLSCFFFKFVLRLSRNDMSFFELVICRDIMFLILLYIYVWRAMSPI